MGAFEDHLATLRNPGDTEPPPTILDELAAAHQEELDAGIAAVTERDRLIAERETELAKTKQELIASKAKNFDLSQQIPAGNSGGSATGGYVPPNNDQLTIKDLFEKRN